MSIVSHVKITLFVCLFVCFSHDYLMILNEKKETFGVYCGLKTGKTVFVSGNYAVIKFHSDDSVEERGFLILFTTAPASK